LPDARPVVEFVFEAFGQTQGGVGVVLAAQPLKHDGGTAFDREGGVRCLEQIITHTRADGEAVLQIRNASRSAFMRM